ncbi:MAG: PIN domain-containing protein [Paludibacter sp.]|jgi:PIN domain nuclease of toxin-antitoxin system|nr:PIN domain-containing protein [Paludibacter sp.]
MRYLIDTNLFINLVEDKFISDDVSYILDYEPEKYISSESIKEFIHLVQHDKVETLIGKRAKKLDVFDFIENTLNIGVKYVTKEHLNTLAMLELVEGHNDPSDRLIIAQAISENLTLISSDRKFPKYRQQGLDFIPNY